MNLPTLNLTLFSTKKAKTLYIIGGTIITMTIGYVAISAGIIYTNHKLDAYALERVTTRDLMPQAVTVKTTILPVISQDDVKSQVDAAIAQSLGK